MKFLFTLLFLLVLSSTCYSQKNDVEKVVAKLSEHIALNETKQASLYFEQNKNILAPEAQNMFYSLISIAKFKNNEEYDEKRTVDAVMSTINSFLEESDVIKDNPQGFMPTFWVYIQFLCLIDNTNVNRAFSAFNEIWPAYDASYSLPYIQTVESVALYRYNHHEYRNAIQLYETILKLHDSCEQFTSPRYIFQYLLGSSHFGCGNDKIAEEILDEVYNNFPNSEKIDNNIYNNLIRERFELAIKHHQYTKASQLGHQLMDIYSNSSEHLKNYINIILKLSELELTDHNTIEGISLYEKGIELALSSPEYDEISRKQLLENLYTFYNIFNINNSDRKFKNEILQYDIRDNQKITSYLVTDSYIDSLKCILKSHSLKLTDVANYVNSAAYLSTHYASIDEEEKGLNIINEAIQTCIYNNCSETDYAKLYVSLGKIYWNLKNDKISNEYLFKALEIYNKYNLNNADYIDLLCQIALNFKNQGDLLNSKIYIDKAYRLTQEEVNIKYDKTIYYGLLSDISNIYASFNEEELALSFNSEILNDIEKNSNLGLTEKYVYQISRVQLLLEFNRFNDAMSVLKTIDPSFLDNNKLYGITFETKFFCNDPDCINDLKKSMIYDKENVLRLYSSINEFSLNKYWDITAGNLNFSHEMILSKFCSPQIIAQAYNNLLFTKTFQLEFNKSKKLKDNEDRNNYDICKSVLEGTKTVDQIKEYLDNNDIAIEFCYITEHKTFKEIQKKYAALIQSKKNENPICIVLCNANELDDIVYTNTLSESYDFANKYYSKDNCELYKLIWEPLVSYIPHKSHVFVSGTGAILQLNLSEISNGETRLSEDYDLHTIISTAYIAEVKNKKYSFDSAVLYGGINYNTSINQLEITQNFNSLDIDKNNEYALYRGIEDRGSWNELTYSLQEVIAIDSILCQNNCNVVCLQSNDATEESFKKLNNNSKSIIHMSTHGFYYQPSNHSFRSNYSNAFFDGSSENSMKYNGILLSGANNAWKDNIKIVGMEDGVLTADEISKLDLSKTELAVLSACQTGLGDISSVEGNSGLIKAFKMAGVHSIISTLWKVSDSVTTIFMKTFYEELMKTNKPYEALKNAKAWIQTQFHEPYYWAGFELIE